MARHAPNHLVGKTGRVTGTVQTGAVGEVMLSIRGGTEAFNAYPYVSDDIIPTGALVVVMEYHEPRTVFVTRLTG